MQRYNFIIVLPSIAAYYFLLTQTASRNAFPDFVSGFRYNVPLRCSFNYSNIFSFGGHSCPVDLYILYIIFELFFLILGRRASHVFLEYCTEVAGVENPTRSAISFTVNELFSSRLIALSMRNLFR